eukprot:TRINITY_DN13560_c0_g2_i1.p1 TRINITY_DN13560_c0_g2~~TRINITY_DN13560_c0_g2_i1.p1  ORF type:complete len:201 (+),score=59.49 TRINITY_DN13560_c0_g2_i1:28-630(+)
MCIRDRSFTLGLFAVYAAVGASAWFHVFTGRIPLFIAQAGIATLWAGFVLAISGMEAWVKFRAPLLRKHVAFDVGRHVFRGLNAMEAPLACTLLGLGGFEDSNLARCAVLILLFQVLYLTPQLEQLAFHRIVQACEKKDTAAMSAEEAAAVEQMRAVVEGSSPPGRWAHVVCVVLELVKVYCLVTYAVQHCQRGVNHHRE